MEWQSLYLIKFRKHVVEEGEDIYMFVTLIRSCTMYAIIMTHKEEAHLVIKVMFN